MSQNSSDKTKQRKKAAVDHNHTTSSDTNTTESGVVGERSLRQSGRTTKVKKKNCNPLW